MDLHGRMANNLPKIVDSLMNTNKRASKFVDSKKYQTTEDKNSLSFLLISEKYDKF